MILASRKLKEYVTLAHLSNQEFAKRLGFDESTTSQVLNRREEPSKVFIERVIRETGLKFEAAFEVSEKDGDKV